MGSKKIAKKGNKIQKISTEKKHTHTHKSNNNEVNKLKALRKWRQHQENVPKITRENLIFTHFNSLTSVSRAFYMQHCCKIQRIGMGMGMEMGIRMRMRIKIGTSIETRMLSWCPKSTRREKSLCASSFILASCVCVSAAVVFESNAKCEMNEWTNMMLWCIKELNV